MINYYKYLPVSEEDKNWGLHVLNAGCNRIAKSAIYPPIGHPSHHYFRWDQGRIFDEFQIIYIARGEGFFESLHTSKIGVSEGTILLLFPQEWHRFKPNPATGWDEYWVGFRGDIIKNLVRNNFPSPKSPILNIGINENVIDLLLEIIEKTKSEKPGYQPLISGAVLHLLGLIYCLTMQEVMKNQEISEVVVNKARMILRSNVHQNISIEKVAEELQVSYSWLRKAFKLYTGIAPGQYLLQLKIDQGKKLLSDHTKSVKEISFELGFESAFYFSKLFKAKAGMAPELYRKKLKNPVSAINQER